MIRTFDLKNKIVLVTGGYGHLGKAITESLLFHGAVVYVVGKDKNRFTASFSGGKYAKDSLFFDRCDVSNSRSIKDSFGRIYRKHKKIDVLINNAFYNAGNSVEELTDAEWAKGMDGTLASAFKCIRAIIPYFKGKGGKIINVASMYGLVAPDFEVYKNHPEFINLPNYGAAKAGLIQISRYYASYLGKLGINVNAVTPGPFPSEKVQKSSGFMRELKKRTCLNRIGKPEEVAGAFVFLASNASDFITGQNIVIDGGWTAK